MRKLTAFIVSFAICGPALLARASSDAPQTARQALLEMFFSKEKGTFVKHLPAATIAALQKSGALANLQQYSAFTGQVQAQENSLQTFEAGSILLSAQDPKTRRKFEVVVDNDSLRGDEDSIELSFHTYKDNQPQKTPYLPRVTFSMKMESGHWALYDIGMAIKFPLADPDFLKAISERMATPNHAASVQLHPQGAPQPVQPAYGSDTGALASARKILAAEATYAATYPTVGYTCRLSDLDGFGAAEPNEHQAMLISSSLASGKHLGYNFVLSGCSGASSHSFQLTASPAGDGYGRRAFCADQSGTVRASLDGNAATCLGSGTPVQ